MISDSNEINTYLVDILREQMKTNKEFYYSSADPDTRIRTLFGRAHDPDKVDWSEIVPRCREELWDGLPVITSVVHFPEGSLDECIRMPYHMVFEASKVAALDARCRDFGFRLVFLFSKNGYHELICPSENDAILLQSFMVIEIQERLEEKLAQ